MLEWAFNCTSTEGVGPLPWSPSCCSDVLYSSPTTDKPITFSREGLSFLAAILIPHTGPLTTRDFLSDWIEDERGWRWWTMKHFPFCLSTCWLAICTYTTVYWSLAESEKMAFWNGTHNLHFSRGAVSFTHLISIHIYIQICATFCFVLLCLCKQTVCY